ncbi:MAG: hypothetical protein QM597_07770 [Aeromicrobium sp.]|uniref:hypothetical protein n=1 Tax=Aeromicrobium sp. TaxID=1871063 RepID=UPI0039E2C56B
MTRLRLLLVCGVLLIAAGITTAALTLSAGDQPQRDTTVVTASDVDAALADLDTAIGQAADHLVAVAAAASSTETGELEAALRAATELASTAAGAPAAERAGLLDDIRATTVTLTDLLEAAER